MKIFLPLIFLFIVYNVNAQDVIYSATGDKVPAKIVSILPGKVKFKNPDNLTGPNYSRGLDKTLIAFNSAGSFLVFTDKKPIADKDAEAFINETPKPRPFDIVVDLKGGLVNFDITGETETNITGVYRGKTIKPAKAALVFVIRKDGTHQLFVAPDKAAAFLNNTSIRINALLNPPPAAAPTTQAAPSTAAATPASAPPTIAANTTGVSVDMAVFSKKALDKTKELSKYLQAICSVKTDRNISDKSVNLACGLFINEDARVEVSSTNSQTKPKYKIRAYLRRLQLISGQYDKVSIEYANINYASNFTKGTDGNYYAVISFAQRFKGFMDGRVVYGDVTRRNVQVVLKSYEKAVDGGSKQEWDVFLEDIGVVQTKELP